MFRFTSALNILRCSRIILTHSARTLPPRIRGNVSQPARERLGTEVDVEPTAIENVAGVSDPTVRSCRKGFKGVRTDLPRRIIGNAGGTDFMSRKISPKNCSNEVNMYKFRIGYILPDVRDEIKKDLQVQAAQAIQKFPDDIEASKSIKQYFDGKYGPNWHCVVGKHFAHFGSYDESTYHYVLIGQIAVLVYRLS